MRESNHERLPGPQAGAGHRMPPTIDRFGGKSASSQDIDLVLEITWQPRREWTRQDEED